MELQYHQGQICYLCEQPIFGSGVVAPPPDGKGCTSYHVECWYHKDEIKLPDIAGDHILIRLDKVDYMNSAGEDTVQVYINASTKLWCFELKYDGENDYVCKYNGGKLVRYWGHYFLVIEIKDDKDN